MIMLLDLWNLLTIISEVVDNIIDSAERGKLPLSVSVLLVAFGVIVYVTWISTNIPDLPPPPRPPYVIQIQAHVNTGRVGVRDNSIVRHTISDVRLLSSGPLVDSVLHRLPRSHHHNQHLPHVQGRGSALFFGLLRRPSARPLLHIRPNSSRSRFQSSNLIVYHQVNVYHTDFRITRDPSNSNLLSEGTYANTEIASNSLDASPEVTSGVFNSTTPVSPTHVLQESGDPSFPVMHTENVDEINAGVLPEENSVNVVQVDIDEINVAGTSRVGVGVNLNGDVTIVERNLSTVSPVELERLLNVESNLVASTMSETALTKDSHQSTADDVRIILKFLNDTQIEVTTQLSEKIADFKRRHFASEISENKSIRLIFNGRVLENDDRTLAEAGIFDHCVVHCLIVTPQNGQHRNRATPDPRESGQDSSESRSSPREGLEPGMFFVSVLGILLIFLWFTCFHFGQQLFTQSAVVSLVVLTTVFVIGVVALYLPVQSNTG